MADVNKTIEITMKANLKQLQQSLENIPNMTKKEAQAMTRALSSEFNKAQKAAKKAADESKKAAQATSKSYQNTANSVGISMDKIASDAKISAHEVKISFLDAEEGTSNLSASADSVSTSLGGTTAVIQELMPELYESAEGALNLANTLGGVAAQAAAGGPLTIKLTGALIVAAAAYDLYSRSTRLAAEQQKRMAKAQEEANSKLNEQHQIASGIASEFNTLNLEYKLLTGQITQVEYDLAAAREISLGKEKKELTIQQKRIEEEERLLVIFDKAQKSLSSISAEERELLNTSMALSDDKEIQKGLDMTAVSAAMNMSRFRKTLLERLQKEKDFSQAIVNRRKETLEKDEEIIKLKSEYLSAQKEEEKRLQDLAAAEAARAINAHRLIQIQSVGIQLSSKGAEAQERINQSIIATLAPTEKIIAQTLLRLDHNKDLQEQVETQIQSAENLAKTDADREAAAAVRLEGEETIATLKAESLQIETEGEFLLDELKQQNSDKENDRIQKTKDAKLKAIRDEAAAIGQMGDLTMGIFKNTVSTIGDMAKATGNENATLIRSLFEMQRVAALGEIAFNVAKNITLASGYLPPLNGLMVAGAVAAGAAQTASVLAQSPPEFHMGGMTPDETIAVVKSGEAVLDRATVNNLGGQQGVNRLQNGQTGGSPEVIVMNPYKHFDRFMTDRNRAGISSRSARRGY